MHRSLSINHDIPSYYARAINSLLAYGSLSGLRVLEVGGSSLPLDLIQNLAVDKWVSVDILDHASGKYQSEIHSEHYNSRAVFNISEVNSVPDHYYSIIDGPIELLPSCFNDSFDVIFSVNCFEHFRDYDASIKKCYQILNSSGYLYSRFGPIWSCDYGSHFWIDDNLNFVKNTPIPRWVHLFENENSFSEKLQGHFSNDVNRQLIYQMFKSDFINRMHYEDYVSSMCRSNFSNGFSFNTTWASGTDADVSELVTKFDSKYRNFHSFELELVAAKYAKNNVESSRVSSKYRTIQLFDPTIKVFFTDKACYLRNDEGRLILDVEFVLFADSPITRLNFSSVGDIEYSRLESPVIGDLYPLNEASKYSRFRAHLEVQSNASSIYSLCAYSKAGVRYDLFRFVL